VNTDKTFSDLGLAEPILHALAARNHTVPTPIQAQAIPELLQGRDLLGIAQTGTGKTGAFALPILHRLSQARGGKQPRALILAPTRELAIQIGEECRAYAANLKLRQAVIFGGVKQGAQVKALVRGLDIVIATPGRLLDLMNQKHVDLRSVEVLVLDEADRMLDMGFVRDVRKIVAALPHKRQSLLFSATMPQEITRLSSDLLREPLRVEVTPQATTVERIDQRVYHVATAQKRALLNNLLADPAMSRVIVFARTKHGANRIAGQLHDSGHAAAAIHGNKSQNARQQALQQFRTGEVRVLVATDIAARGIDIDGVSHVVNYELPKDAESYVHRIGRTARAGKVGVALSFCDAAERGELRDIEKLTRQTLTVVGEAPTGPDRSAKEPRQAREPRRNKEPRRDRNRGPRSDEARSEENRGNENRPAQAARPTAKPAHGKNRRGKSQRPAGGKPRGGDDVPRRAPEQRGDFAVPAFLLADA
jgi:ATP-dependent RNA helicase RhlE